MEFTEALRRMTVVDANYLDALLRGADAELIPPIDARALALARIAALVSTGASMHSYGAQVDAAVGAGVSPSEIVGTLAGIAPIVGSAAVATAAPMLALALGYDTELALEAPRPPDQRNPNPNSRARSTASGRDDTPNLR